MAYNELRLRALSNAERREIRDGLLQLRPKWNPFMSRIPPDDYISHLEKLLAGPYRPFPPLPPWTQKIWELDDPDSDEVVLQHKFDMVLNNCDLSRLSVFMRSRDGQVVKEYMKSAWTRVTLCIDTAIYGLYHGDCSLICYGKRDLQFAQSCGGPTHNEEIDVQAALSLLQARLTLMCHATN